MRTSTDATLVLVTIAPSNHIPETIVRLDIQTSTIFGGASGRATGDEGHVRGARCETTTFAGRGIGFDAHALDESANATAMSSGRGFTLGRNMKGAPTPSSPGEAEPFVTSSASVSDSHGAGPLDWLVTLAGVWIMTGLFIDAHEHIFETIDTFLNPWHLTMYSGAVFAVIVIAGAIVRNYRKTGSWRASVPFGYAQSAVGVVCLLVGGALDAIWHSIFGFEHQLDLLLSPPHLFLLSGLFFLVSGPIRSALGRPPERSLLSQVPAVVSMALAFQVIQFVTQFGFYPEALMRDHPMSQVVYRHEQFVLSVFLFYKQALEIMIVLWQSALLAAAVLYVCARKQLHFGALIVLCVAEKLWIGGELSEGVREFALVCLAGFTAGLAGDAIVAKWRPSAANPGALRLLGFVVPAVYFGAYFAYAVPMFGGTWWDASFLFGSIVLSGLVGICVAQLVIGGFQARSSLP